MENLGLGSASTNVPYEDGNHGLWYPFGQMLEQRLLEEEKNHKRVDDARPLQHQNLETRSPRLQGLQAQPLQPDENTQSTSTDQQMEKEEPETTLTEITGQDSATHSLSPLDQGFEKVVNDEYESSEPQRIIEADTARIGRCKSTVDRVEETLA